MAKGHIVTTVEAEVSIVPSETGPLSDSPALRFRLCPINTASHVPYPAVIPVFRSSITLALRRSELEMELQKAMDISESESEKFRLEDQRQASKRHSQRSSNETEGKKLKQKYEKI